MVSIDKSRMFKKIIPLCIFLSLASSLNFLQLKETSYNPTLAEKFWNLCMACYCSESRISEWNLGFVSTLYPKVTDITVVMNSTGNAMGFTAYNPEEDEVLIVFRGTQPLSIKNWIDDLDTFFMDYPACQGCKVHEGFYKTYLDIQQSILTAAKELFAKYPNSKKLVTGHSLGGALAIHASVDIINKFGNIDEFYTYGSPRVGNQQFATYIDNFIPGNFNSRVVHNRDPVPHLPLKIMGFSHINREIFYNEDSSQFTVCTSGEDPTCSNSQLDLNILDHLNYMGKEIVPYMIECNL